MSYNANEIDAKYDVAHSESGYPAVNKAGSDIYVDTYVEGTDEEKRLVRLSGLSLPVVSLADPARYERLIDICFPCSGSCTCELSAL